MLFCWWVRVEWVHSAAWLKFENARLTFWLTCERAELGHSTGEIDGKSETKAFFPRNDSIRTFSLSVFEHIRSNRFTRFKLSQCWILVKLIVGSAWRMATGISAATRSNKKYLCFIFHWFSTTTMTFFFEHSCCFCSRPFYWEGQTATVANYLIF